MSESVVSNLSSQQYPDVATLHSVSIAEQEVSSEVVALKQRGKHSVRVHEVHRVAAELADPPQLFP